VISGLVGCGKTMLLRRIEAELTGQKIIVAKSLAVDKHRTTLPTLIDALFFDLKRSASANFGTWCGNNGSRLPSSSTKREISIPKL